MSIRRVPLEVIQCRHCDESFQTSEKHLRNALLCQDCFDIREVNRKGYPRVLHEKAEHNLGDRYGENKGYKSVVCAACGQTYELVPADYVDRSIEEQKEHYDRLFAFHKGLKPFKHIVFNYMYAPKGWTNDILCQHCFGNIQLGCEDEIKQMHERESERVQKEAAHKVEAEIKRRSKEYEESVSDKNFWRLMQILFVIFAVPLLLSMCSGIWSSDKAPADLYYRK